MGCIFENDAAFDPLAELVVWRQDKSPHLEGTFKATVVHGESQADNAGHVRGGTAADPWSVICSSNPAECVGIESGDTLTLLGGTVLTVQQISKDPAFGWVMKCTSDMRGPR